MNSMNNKYSFILLLFLIINSSCDGFMGSGKKLDKLETVDYVDLKSLWEIGMLLQIYLPSLRKAL